MTDEEEDKMEWHANGMACHKCLSTSGDSSETLEAGNEPRNPTCQNNSQPTVLIGHLTKSYHQEYFNYESMTDRINQIFNLMLRDFFPRLHE